jgi:hypothetical protein
MNKLIRCIDCNAIHVITPFDQAPEYVLTDLAEGSPTENASEYNAIEKCDFAEFAHKHPGHRIENLSIIENSSYSEGPYFDPHRVLYFETTNGKDTFLIKRWRRSVAEPVRYEVVPAKLEVKMTVEIQHRDLEKQMCYEMREPLVTQEKVRLFIEIVQEEARQIDPEKSAEEIAEVHEANISYLPLGDEHIERILSKSRAIFTNEELVHIERFIRNNAEYDGVMSFLIKKTAIFHPAEVLEQLAN